MKHRVEKIGEHTYLIEEYSEHASVYMYLLEGTTSALLIDTGFGTIPLKEICEKITNLPIHVALTHGHVDHIGGTGFFEKVWMDREDQELYRMHRQDTMRHIFTEEEVYPVKETCDFFQTDMRFDLGARIVKVIKTPGHSVGSVCFLDEKNRWLFTGDCCCKAHVLLQMEYSASMETYQASLETLMGIREQYDVMWPGHHEKPVEPAILSDFLTAVDGILKGTMEGIEMMLPMGKTKVLEYKEIGIEYGNL